MGKTLIRIATWAGILGACAIMWLAYSKRLVPPEEFRERLEKRIVELDAMRGARPAVEPERAARLAAAARLGAHLAFGDDGSELRVALDRLAAERFASAGDPLTPADRAIILGDPRVAVHVQSYLERREVAPLTEAATAGPNDQILAAIDVLCLDLSLAIEDGAEQRVLLDLQALMQLATDLMGEQDPNMWVLGEAAFHGAFRAADRSMVLGSVGPMRQATLVQDQLEEGRVMAALTKPESRDRLRFALDLLVAATPERREIWRLKSRRTLAGLLIAAERDHSDGVPIQWVDAVEASIELHERFREAMDEGSQQTLQLFSNGLIGEVNAAKGEEKEIVVGPFFVERAFGLIQMRVSSVKALMDGAR